MSATYLYVAQFTKKISYFAAKYSSVLAVSNDLCNAPAIP